MTEQLDLGDFEYHGPPSRMMTAAQKMVEKLREDQRLDETHEFLVEHLFVLIQRFMSSGGRGASTAMLSVEIRNTWETLAAAPEPESAEDEDAAPEYDVVLLPTVVPDAS